MKGNAKINSILSLLLISCLFVTSFAYSATIVGSKHDLLSVYGTHQSYGYEGNAGMNSYGEVCVYCHTPHGANTGSDAPLWNRNNPTSSYTVYTSTTMDTAPASTPSSVSLACLSCHDGTIAVDSIRNAPGSGTNLSGPWYGTPTPPTLIYHRRMKEMGGGGNCGVCHNDMLIVWPSHDGYATYLSTDLSDDHPVSMPVPDPGDDPDFNTPEDIVSAGLKLFGSTNTVECSSCHNVHDPAISPFLRKSNSGSALCSTCHTK